MTVAAEDKLATKQASKPLSTTAVNIPYQSSSQDLRERTSQQDTLPESATVLFSISSAANKALSILICLYPMYGIMRLKVFEDKA